MKQIKNALFSQEGMPPKIESALILLQESSPFRFTERQQFQGNPLFVAKKEAVFAHIAGYYLVYST